MIQLAANLSTMFTELPFMQRFTAAADADFSYVEYQFPYSFGSANQVATAARAANVDVALMNITAGEATRGDRGIGCRADRIAEFREGVEMAIEYARAVGCPRINCLAGIVPEGVAREAAFETLVDNVQFAADKLAPFDLRLMVEAVNARSIPGFLINTSKQALAVLDAADRDNAFFQYDTFHMQISEGDLAKTIATILPRIGHIQIADAPDRHEPGTGEINFPWLLAEIDRMGYAGPIGCEYVPVGDTVVGLSWARAYLDKQRLR